MSDTSTDTTDDENIEDLGGKPTSYVPVDFRTLKLNDTGFLLTPDDETMQFSADRFMAEQFCVMPTKTKRVKNPFRGLGEAIEREEHARLRTNVAAEKENKECDKREEGGTAEDSTRRMVECLRNPEKCVATKQLGDTTEIKAKEFESLLKDGFEAYGLGQYTLAAAKYKLAWEMLANVTLKSRLERAEEDVICYMLCLSLLETEQLSNLYEAMELLISLEKRCSRTLPAVYYALSKAHHKHCRYESALKSVEEGFAFLNGSAQLTEYAVPGADAILKESTRDGLTVYLAATKDECSKWHPPDALCCAGECVPTSRWYDSSRNIYFSDPSFNGMVVLICSNSKYPCATKFHPACWKLEKDRMSAVKKLSDKDIIGYECFTPDCEHAKGERSLINRVEIYGDDGKLKSHVDVSANSTVWVQRRPLSKGAVPKQPLKPKRTSEKTRRPVNVAARPPRTNCKESQDEDCLKRAEGLTKLAELRKKNFAVKPECEWRPDLVMYGNPQMTEVADFLGGFVFDNDTSQVAAAKIFIFTYFYEYVKENGCVSKNDITQKWEEDKYTICENFNDVLRDHTDIFDFLLQSYKLVSMGAYIGTAENLPELYSLVRGEVCSYLRFSITDQVRSSAATTQDDIYNTAISDFDEKRNKERKYGSATTAETEETAVQTGGFAAPHSDSDSPEPETAQREETNEVSDVQESPTETTFRSLPSLVDSKPEFESVVPPEELIVSSFLFGENYASKDAVESSDDAVVRSFSVSASEEEKNETEPVGALSDGETQSRRAESIESEEIFTSVENFGTRASSSNENLDYDDKIEPGLDLGVVGSSLTAATNDVDSDEVESTYEKIPSIETCTSNEMITENGEETALPASQSPDTEENADTERSEEPLKAQENSLVDNSDKAMTTMIENILTEFMNEKIVSQVGIKELTEDLEQLKKQYAALDTRKKTITWQLETCQRELRQKIDENDVLRTKNTKLMDKMEKLDETKVEVQTKLVALSSENATIKNEVLALKKERDKMHKKLDKYLACVKEHAVRDSKQREPPQTEETKSEQRSSEEVTKFIARKARIESLNKEVVTNDILLKKHIEKCHDHIRLYTEVEKLFAMLVGQQVVIGRGIEAWQKIENFLLHAVEKNKTDYTNLKAVLESDRPIENLEDTKIQMPHIVFPQLPPLVEIFRIEQSAKFNRAQTQMYLPPRPIEHHQQFPFVPSPVYYPIQPNIPSVPIAYGPPRDQPVNVLPQSQAKQNSPRNIDGENVERKHPERSLSSNNVHAKYPIRSEMIAATTGATGTGENKGDSVGNNRSDGASQVPIDRQSVRSKKIGTDSLVQKLRMKFEGVPEMDLLDSVQELRKMHNDSLTGMRVGDIILETEPLVRKRQEKHMVPYLLPVQTLPQERPAPPASEPGQRKIPPLMPSGQGKNKKFTTAEKLDCFASNSHDLPSSSSKKPAWGSVASVPIDWKKSYVETECSICFDGMKKMDERNPVYTLPCKHSFHTACIKKWLGENSVCPICRVHCTMDDEFPPLP